ncbi:MAG TPA: beta-ketoacyl-[acyl-carrier-protein] synthase family protein, partial [Mycobacteriales bacterium]|nr:beta-ketoacyl-[acyl-carrier-protein] synthase family protein [Mycobacteriales bacterium]
MVVTGLGPVSAIGTGRAAFCRALRAGRLGFSPISSFDASRFPHRYAGEVHDFAPAGLVRRLSTADWGRSSLFAAAAARLAWSDARLDTARTDPDAVAVAIGTTTGESQVLEALTAASAAGGLGAMPTELLDTLPAERLAHAVSTELGVRGESVTIATACSAGNYAVGYGYDLIAGGDAEIVLAGGADAVCRWSHAGFYRLGALDEVACHPFDRDRAGIITAEGGAAVVLEELEHARSRGAPVLAEVLGHAMNCDAEHMVSPSTASIAACMRAALVHAGVTPAQVDYVCAHGTGTRTNDLVESLALREVFGRRPPPVSSIKSMLGHSMGAASAFGIIACTLAIAEGFLPPTMGWSTPDPA